MRAELVESITIEAPPPRRGVLSDQDLWRGGDSLDLWILLNAEPAQEREWERHHHSHGTGHSNGNGNGISMKAAIPAAANGAASGNPAESKDLPTPSQQPPFSSQGARSKAPAWNGRHTPLAASRAGRQVASRFARRGPSVQARLQISTWEVRHEIPAAFGCERGIASTQRSLPVDRARTDERARNQFLQTNPLTATF